MKIKAAHFGDGTIGQVGGQSNGRQGGSLDDDGSGQAHGSDGIRHRHPGSRRSRWSKSPAAASATPISAIITTACAPSMSCRSASGMRSAATSSKPAPMCSGTPTARSSFPPSFPAAVAMPACAASRRSARNQKMPGNDIHGGFATHIIVPARGLCVVDEHRLAAAEIDLADLSVIADAVTTPYQAVVQAGVSKGDLVVVNGIGGVGGYCAQIAAAMGGVVIAIDVERREARRHRQAVRRAHAQRQDHDAARHQGGDPGLRQAAQYAPERVDHFRMLRLESRAGDRLQPDQSRRDARRRRLHHGQGRGAAVEPDGLPRARARQLGLPARALSRRAWSLCSMAASRSVRSSRSIR